MSAIGGDRRLERVSVGLEEGAVIAVGHARMLR
jgi:hypothetical protein